MPVYKYQYISKTGDMISGKISGADESAAIERLKRMNFEVVSLKPARFEALERFVKSEKKVKVDELSLFSRQLASMINAGIPITRAIGTISKQTKNVSFKNALTTISRNVESGMSLTDSFSGYPHIFNELYLSMISSGEIGGMLEEVLVRLADQLQKEKKLNDSIKAATFYPKMVLSFAVILLLAMLLILVPIFKGFISSDTEIPKLTQFVFDFSDAFKNRWYLFIGVFIGFIILIKTLIKTKKGKRVWDRFKVKVPIFGPINDKTMVARFSRTLSTLLDGGIPVVQALQSSGETAGSIIIEEKVRISSYNIEQGNKIAEELDRQDIFPPTVVHMINVGEESGQLPELLEKIAIFYEEEVENLTKGLSAVIEPLMLAVVGIVVGGMLVSMYLPIFTAVASQMSG